MTDGAPLSPEPSTGPPPVIVVMGVSGAGKTTVARALAARLGWTFEEGDRLHPPANIAKMEAGQPLNDADRAPWLEAIGAWIDTCANEGRPGIVSCSALKRAYRDVLRRGRPQVRIVYLHGTQALIAERLAKRTHHFMPPHLLGSQFHDLEPPSPGEGALIVDIDQTPQAQAEEVVRQLGLAR